MITELQECTDDVTEVLEQQTAKQRQNPTTMGQYRESRTKLRRSRINRRKSRINPLFVVVGVTIIAILALVATIRVGPWPFDGSSSSDRSSRRSAGAGFHEIEGSVKKVESDTRIIQVSSGILGLGATPLALSDETQILVGEKEGALGDLREGVRVRVSFEARPDTRVARVIEVLIGGVGARRPRGLRVSPVNVAVPSASDREAVPPSAAMAPETRAKSADVVRPEPRATADAEAAWPERKTQTDSGVQPRPPTPRRSTSTPAVVPKPVIALTLVPATDSAIEPRHAGTVVEVGGDRLVVDELGPAGEEQKLRITVTPATRIIESERNPHATSVQDGFTAKPTTLTDIKKGDYVVIDVSREGTKLVAYSVMVTLRRGGR